MAEARVSPHQGLGRVFHPQLVLIKDGLIVHSSRVSHPGLDLNLSGGLLGFEAARSPSPTLVRMVREKPATFGVLHPL